MKKQKKSRLHYYLQACLCSRFSRFFLDEKESLKGMTVFGSRLSGCLHTSRLETNSVNTLTRVSFSARGFIGFLFFPFVLMLLCLYFRKRLRKEKWDFLWLIDINQVTLQSNCADCNVNVTPPRPAQA